MEINDEEMKQAEQVQAQMNQKIPDGFIEINLSSHGKLGAPASFHIKNFTTESLMSLALADDEDLPIKVVDMLQDLIFEKDCDIKKFHENEVVETLLILYKTFYQSTLKDQDWPLSDADYEQLKEDSGGENSTQYQELLKAIKSKRQAYKFDIDLNNVEFYELGDDFKSDAHVTKKDGFTCVYTYPRYGDVCVLRKMLTSMPFFEKGDKQFAAVRESEKHRAEVQQKADDGDMNAHPERCARFPEKEIKEWKDFETQKAIFATRAVKAYHLKEIHGKDISNLPLDKKMEFAADPELDHSTFEAISKAYDNMQVGPKKTIKAYDPILHKVVDLPYTFRVFAILQAVRDYKPDSTIIEFK